MSNGNRYVGQFVDDEFEGKGHYWWRDGAEYEGTYVEGRTNGFGTYKFVNGDVYSGGWKDDKRHGVGIHMCKNGRRWEEQWTKGSNTSRKEKVIDGRTFLSNCCRLPRCCRGG